MSPLVDLVQRVNCVLKSRQGLNRNLLQNGQGNLEGAEVVFDKNIPGYSVSPKSGFIRYFGSSPLTTDGKPKDMPWRRITSFKNPDLVLLLVPDGWFNVKAKADLLSLEDYQKQHKEFLKYMGRYGFVHEGDRVVSVFQELVDRECEIYEEIMSRHSKVPRT